MTRGSIQEYTEAVRWRYLDARTRDLNPTRRDLTINCLANLDVVIG